MDPQAERLPAGDRAPGPGRGARRRTRGDGRQQDAAARHPARLQGHLRDRRRAHHGAFPHPRRQRAEAGRRDGAPAARRGRGDAGQAGDARVRHRRAGVRPALAAGAQSLGHAALHRRLQLRLGGGGGGRAGAGRAGLGHRRLDPAAGGLLRHRRHQADAGPGVAPRRDPAGAQPGHRRPDGLDGAGLRDPARCAGRPRSGRSGLGAGPAGVLCGRHRRAAAGPARRAAAPVLRARRAGLARDAADDEPRGGGAARSRLPGGGRHAARRCRNTTRSAG